MRNTIDKITRDLSNIELRDTLDYGFIKYSKSNYKG